MFNWFKRKLQLEPDYRSICPTCLSLSDLDAHTYETQLGMCSLCDSEFVTESHYIDLDTFLNNYTLDEMQQWVKATEEKIATTTNANVRWYAKDHLKAIQRVLQLKQKRSQAV